jgi:HK97 family phage major capsid protein
MPDTATATPPGMLEYFESEKAQHVKVCEDILVAAKKDFRELTPEERDTIKQHTAEAHKLNNKIKVERENTALAESIASLAPDPIAVGSPETIRKGKLLTIGDVFVGSDAYKGLLARGTSGKFQMMPLQLPEFGAVAGIVTEDAGDNSDMFLPQRIPGIQEPVEPPLGLTDLFATATVTLGNSVLLVREKFTGGLPDNNAAVVAEAAPKPASDIQFETVPATLTKIATVIKVSTEMLEDETAMRTYLNSRLATFVRQKREDTFATQLLAQAGQSAVAADVGGDNLYDAIMAGAVDVFREGGLPADAVAMTMLDYATLMVSKDEQGRYLSGGPFQTPGTTLWGRYRVAITERLGDGNVVVGAFNAGGTVWRKGGGVTVDATNSNEDDFLNNLTAIRAEERAVLFLQRPDAFAVVSVTS